MRHLAFNPLQAPQGHSLVRGERSRARTHEGGKRDTDKLVQKWGPQQGVAQPMGGGSGVVPWEAEGVTALLTVTFPGPSALMSKSPQNVFANPLRQ